MTTNTETIGFTAPKYEYTEYNENLYEWTERGVKNPNKTEWSKVYYTCRFCPTRSETPTGMSHSSACPVHQEED